MEEISALRRLALAAKKRLSGASQEQKNLTKKENCFTIYKNLYNGEYKVVQLSTEEDEQLYKKVCDILDKDYDTPSPIGQLIDKDVYSMLNNEDKQRYLFTMIDKYNIYKKRYDNNKIRKVN
jgi:hypothetical protein